MELDWLQKHHDLMESIIRFGNSYANAYRVQKNFGTELKFSAAQIQTLECVFESQFGGEKMSQMAKRIGVSKSAFSKNVNVLVEKGLLEKHQISSNFKDIYLKPTDEAYKVYLIYVEYVKNECFNKMFKIADTIKPSDKNSFIEILNIFSDSLEKHKTNKRIQ
jgi:DNA-binding MarR family transcriptional regulator